MRWRVSRLAVHTPTTRGRTMLTGSQMVEHQRRAGKQKESQVIPAEAVEAAANAWIPDWQATEHGVRGVVRERMKGSLEAAAPHILEEAEQEITNLKRIIALLVLDNGGRATISRRDMAALSDETVIETTEDVTAGGWAIRVDPPDELEKRRKYTALDAISELGSDEPNERFTKRSKT